MEFVWYVIETKCMKDGLAVRMLREWCAAEAIKVWRPLKRVRVGRGATRRRIVRSRLPGYLLLRMPKGFLTDRIWQAVKNTKGVLGWLCTRPGEPPREVSDSQVRALRMAFVTEARKTRELKSRGFQPGEIVKVVNKMLVDLYGPAIARIVSVDNRARVRILLNSTGAVVPLSLKATDLRSISSQAVYADNFVG